MFFYLLGRLSLQLCKPQLGNSFCTFCTDLIRIVSAYVCVCVTGCVNVSLCVLVLANGKTYGQVPDLFLRRKLTSGGSSSKILSLRALLATILWSFRTARSSSSRRSVTSALRGSSCIVMGYRMLRVLFFCKPSPGPIPPRARLG